ncbi:MAG: sigma 54-interacting transcriptional regulator [Bryobacteraceae bacterium]|nr:sigma 54-interacting transcriptional regulator [Bryobacteraceae bacterium]
MCPVVADSAAFCADHRVYRQARPNSCAVRRRCRILPERRGELQSHDSKTAQGAGLATGSRRSGTQQEARTNLASTLRSLYPFPQQTELQTFITFENAARAAQSDSTVLVRGETGTGKELLAKAIHFNSPRRERPLIVINCGAIPKELLESELFGHTKGSFTGAVVNKKGKIEMADQGTLFLDEVGEMPLELQVKLLRLIQEREIEKIGAANPTKVNVRIIAATHRNLQAMVEDGTFREDLYYRLAVIPLTLPPLRERPADISELVAIFFKKFTDRLNRPALRLPPSLLAHFCTHRWPGNVRELENVIERLVVLAPGEEITVEDLPDFLRRERPPLEAIQLELPPEGISMEAVERELVVRALKKFNWNQTKAAEYLDISRKMLIYRMEKFDLKKEGDA